MNLKIVSLLKILILIVLFNIVQSYIDIPLTVQRQGQLVAYNMPININSYDYQISISLENKEEYIIPLSQHKKTKKSHQLGTQSNNRFGEIQVTSLEGYSFEGWKRYFMQALLYIEQKYYHQIKIKLDAIEEKQNTNRITDGVMALGPEIANDKLFQEIKMNTEFIGENTFSIYSSANGDKANLQLGGYEQTYAYGHEDGALFYEIPILGQDNKWKLNIQKLGCSRQRSNRWDYFTFTTPSFKAKLSLQSPFLVIPLKSATQVERNFETRQIECLIEQNRFACINMTSIDLALNMFSLKMQNDQFINISLYDLRDDYEEKTKKTTFYVKFSDKQDEYQIGDKILRPYYLSINMDKQKLAYSPINRFNYGLFNSVYIIRFIIGFIIFTFVVAIGAGIYQTFTDPYRKNKFVQGQEGIRLVTYQKPDQEDD